MYFPTWGWSWCWVIARQLEESVSCWYCDNRCRCFLQPLAPFWKYKKEFTSYKSIWLSLERRKNQYEEHELIIVYFIRISKSIFVPSNSSNCLLDQSCLWDICLFKTIIKKSCEPEKRINWVLAILKLNFNSESPNCMSYLNSIENDYKSELDVI